MNYPIIFPSAYEFWMHEPVRQAEPLLPAENKLSSGTGIWLPVRNSLFPSRPLHVGIPRSHNRVNNTNIVTHVLPSELPAGSFLQLECGLLVGSPELCFLQAATKVPFSILVEMANNLCAAYYLDPASYYKQKRRTPLTDIRALDSYLNSAAGISGVKKARQALAFAVENSFSPYESRIAAARVPFMYRGGYGIAKGELNFEIFLSAEGAEILGRKSCCCDTVWPEDRVAFEYDSNIAHLDEEQHEYDTKRHMAIIRSGYRLIVATAHDFSSFRNAEKMFLLIRKTLGMRTHADRLEKTQEARWQMYQQLFRRKW